MCFMLIDRNVSSLCVHCGLLFHSRALADAEKALFLHPEWAKGYFRKGRALLGLERIDEAENFYLRAVELDPNYRDACEELRKLRLDQITVSCFKKASMCNVMDVSSVLSVECVYVCVCVCVCVKFVLTMLHRIWGLMK